MSTTGWAPATQVRNILNDMIRQHDRQIISGISDADLADYTTKIMEIFR